MAVQQTPEKSTKWHLDTCVFGYGVVCGLEVHIDTSCNIHLSGGSAITTTGNILHLSEKSFYAFLKETSPDVKAHFDNYTVWELVAVGTPFDQATMDAFNQQFPGDQPLEDFLNDKVLTLFIKETDASPTTKFILLTTGHTARLTGVEEELKKLAKIQGGRKPQGIFGKRELELLLEPEEMDQLLRPQLNLPCLTMPRFGYRQLAILDEGRIFDWDNPLTYDISLDNLKNPFTSIHSFEDIFLEYKIILDEHIPVFVNALKILHTHFGNLLSYEGDAYLKSFRTILQDKWDAFLRDGEHLYYVQYFYDWFCDLNKAYCELREALDNFAEICLCKHENQTPPPTESHLLLGSVLRGRTSYQPLFFRDYLRSPLGEANHEEKLREIKCMHWLMMMMIWTFDLPFLRLEEKVLVQKRYIPTPVEEDKDSTDHWESQQTNADGKVDIEDLFIKITPSKPPYYNLGSQAIPYYYPLDADSPYSVHRFWDFHATKMNRIQQHLSYNAHIGDDSYSRLPQVLYPLLYKLKQYPFLKIEGHIGKKITLNTASGEYTFIVNHLHELIEKYNLSIDVIAVDVSKNTLAVGSPLARLLGMEHLGGVYPGQTFVFFYSSEENPVDIEECERDPVIPAFTVFADFTLPYRYSCCQLVGALPGLITVLKKNT